MKECSQEKRFTSWSNILLRVSGILSKSTMMFKGFKGVGGTNQIKNGSRVTKSRERLKILGRIIISNVLGTTFFTIICQIKLFKMYTFFYYYLTDVYATVKMFSYTKIKFCFKHFQQKCWNLSNFFSTIF